MDGKNKPEQGASPSQHDRFIKAARQLGADEDEGAFKVKLAVIAWQRPKGAVPKPECELNQADKP